MRDVSRFLLVSIVFAAACVSPTPAPISYGRNAAERSAPPPAVSVPRDAIGEGLAPYGLRPEQVQPVAPFDLPRTHRVAQGETAYDIAARYQIPVSALLDANHLTPAAVLPGTVLSLPQHEVHVARPGETLRDIANAHDVDPRSLALFNRLDPDAQVRAGDRIYLPFAESGRPPPVQAVATNSAMQWPIRGAVLARFGATLDGVRSDALEIGGEEGASVAAAAEGEVIYAGRDLPAYGVLVLVRHADDLVSTYGYLRRATVRVGQRVGVGETIGELDGRPDGAARLLFQVRRHGQLIDPEPLLAPAG